MVSLYAAAVLRRRLWGAVLLAITSALYGLPFVILRLEAASLLAGTLVLLAALGATMFATRRLDGTTVGTAPAELSAPGASAAPQ